MVETRQNIKTFTFADLSAELKAMGLKKYRARQIFDWLYRKLAGSFDEMTNISKDERALLANHFAIPSLTVLYTDVSADGTMKFLFGLEDGHTIESVLIPDKDRLTLCISSQVGCSQGCRFCLTGSGGFERNLKAWEIADQVLTAEKYLETGGYGRGIKRRITNIVLMGMGEPLANFDEVAAALRLITVEHGLGFSGRRVTLSTAGLVPGIDRLGKSRLGINLAVSLNSAADEVRSRIMPINRRYPMKELLSACRRYPLKPRQRITFEYVMLKGVNDSEQDAHRLARLLKGIRCKINLIPFNPFPGSAFERPDEDTVARFQKILLGHHYTAPIRESRGRDISAACGQLRERTTRGG